MRYLSRSNSNRRFQGASATSSIIVYLSMHLGLQIPNRGGSQQALETDTDVDVIVSLSSGESSMVKVLKASDQSHLGNSTSTTYIWTLFERRGGSDIIGQSVGSKGDSWEVNLCGRKKKDYNVCGYPYRHMGWQHMQ